MASTTAEHEDSGKLAYWDTQLTPVLELHDGRQMLKPDYFNKGGAEKFGHGHRIRYQYERRECVLPGCDSAELVVDWRNYSFCPKCHTIYNDGIPPRAEKTNEQILKATAVRNQAVKTNRKKGYKALMKR